MVKNSLGVSAKSGQVICHELTGIVTWWSTNGINIVGGERRFADLGRVEVQFEPLMSLCRFLNLEAPLVIITIIDDFSTRC